MNLDTNQGMTREDRVYVYWILYIIYLMTRDIRHTPTITSSCPACTVIPYRATSTPISSSPRLSLSPVSTHPSLRPAHPPIYLDYIYRPIDHHSLVPFRIRPTRLRPKFPPNCHPSRIGSCRRLPPAPGVSRPTPSPDPNPRPTS